MSIAFLSRHEHSERNLSENTDRLGSKIVIFITLQQTGICWRTQTEWELTKDWDIANVTNVTLNIKNLTCGDISTPCSWFENLHCFSEDCSIGKAAARCWDLKSTLSKTNHNLFFTLDRTIPLLTCRAVTWRKTRETETGHFILISCKMELNSVLYQSEICRPDHVWVDAGTVREGGADEGKAIGAASEVWWSWRQRTYDYDDQWSLIMEAKLVTITMTPSGVLCWRWWPALYSWTSRSSSLLFFSSSSSSSSIWICQFLSLITWFNSSLGDDSFWRWDNQTQGEVWPARRRNLQ